MSYTRSQIQEKIQSLNFPVGKYIVLGGASLAMRGMRETRDIDILVIPEFFEELIRQGWTLDSEFEQKWHRKRLVREDVEVYQNLYFDAKKESVDAEEVIKIAEMIDGISFQPLDHLLMAKQDSGREKDLRDVELIRSYLAGC